MHYLFGFSGRINRAKMWLFILVTLAWEIVIGLIAAIGFDWSDFMNSLHDYHGPEAVGADVVAWPGLGGLRGQVALGLIVVLVVLYAISFLAVYAKRIHDRNKSAWWLVPFAVIPWGLTLLKIVAVPYLLAMGDGFGPLGIGLSTADLIGSVLALWAFIELFFFRGTAGENRFGPDPLAR